MYKYLTSQACVKRKSTSTSKNRRQATAAQIIMNPLNLGIYHCLVTAATSAGISLKDVFHEHTAFRVVTSGEAINGKVESAALTMTGPGVWMQMKQFGDEGEKPHTVFLQGVRCPWVRFELLGQSDVPNHEAFRVLNLPDCKKFCDALAADPNFEHLQQFDVDNGTTYAKLFKVKGTETVIQIIWRSPESVFFAGDTKA